MTQTLLRPFINDNLPDGWYLASSPVITANWSAASSQRWSLSIGGGAGKILKIGDQPINMSPSFYDYVVRPSAGRNGPCGFRSSASHGDDIRAAGYPDAASLVSDVAANFSEIYRARDGRLLLAKPNGRVRIAVVELRPNADGDHWTASTAGLYRPDYFQNQELLWRRPGPDAVSPEGGSLFDPKGQSSSGILPQDRELEQARRGRITLSDARDEIKLFKNADASTFVHETGHAWLEELMRDAADEAAFVSEVARFVEPYLQPIFGVAAGLPVLPRDRGTPPLHSARLVRHCQDRSIRRESSTAADFPGKLVDLPPKL